jgi:hypothetical protein
LVQLYFLLSRKGLSEFLALVKAKFIIAFRCAATLNNRGSNL